MSPVCYHLVSLIPIFLFLIPFSVQLMCSCISCQNETFLPEAVVHLCSCRAPGWAVLKGRNITLGGLWTVPGYKFLTHENPAYLSHFQPSFPCSCLGLLQSLKTPHRSCFRSEIHLDLPSLLPLQIPSIIISGKFIFLPVQRSAGLEVKNPNSSLIFFFSLILLLLITYQESLWALFSVILGQNCCFVAVLRV